MMLRRSLLAFGLASIAAAGAANAAEPVKVGVIGPFSGPFSGAFGTPFRQGVEAYVARHGADVGGVAVEWVYRDLPQPDPQRARALAQELVVKDKVQYLAGFVFTPNALAVAPLIQSAKIPTVIFNASTSAIVSKSSYFVRTSNTLPQVTVPVARNAIDRGVRTVVTAVADYGPGIDAEGAFRKTFEAGGGRVLESIRMPLSTTDFSAYMQRIRLAKPDALFVFLPFGPPTYSFVKAYRDNGLNEAGIRFVGTSETEESSLQEQGAAALGLETGYHYSAAHESAENAEFIATLRRLNPTAVANPATVAAYDGAHVLYAMIKATSGKVAPDAAIDAVRGLTWESPRGPVRIDRETRDIVQNVYMRVVEKEASGRLFNRETKTYEAQPDYGAEGNK